MQKTKACSYFNPGDYGFEEEARPITADDIVGCFRYDSLIRRNVIPDLMQITKTCRAKNIPEFMMGEKKNAYFKLFFKEYLRLLYLEEDEGASLAVKCKLSLSGDDVSLSDCEFSQLTTFVDSICRKLRDEWQDEYGERFTFNEVITKGDTTVNIDMITYIRKRQIPWLISFDPWNLKSMGVIIMKALINWAFCRGSQIVGIILPLCAKYVVFDLSGWTKKQLQKDIEQIVRCIENQRCVTYKESLFMKYPAGNSVCIEDSLLNGVEAWISSCLENYGNIRPIQTFLPNPFDNNPEYKSIKPVVTNFNLPLFIHAPLNMNISGSSDGSIKILRSTLRYGAIMGARAVTVHAGKSNKSAVEDARERQAEVLRSSLSSECLLSLETPCGKVNELCTTFDSMNEFFLEYFTPKEREKIGITIDTCHVFNAGNDPLKYIQDWIEKGSVRIALCHWNDATNFFGVGVEGHHNPDIPGGAIGYNTMKSIAKLCEENDIPFLFE